MSALRKITAELRSQYYLHLRTQPCIGIHGVSFPYWVRSPVANSIFYDKQELDYFNLFV